MPNKAHAELLQVVGGQLGQYRGIDGVVAERLLVLLQPETVEPGPNVHALLPAAVTVARAYRTPNCRDARILNAACLSPQSRRASCSDSPGDGALGWASATPSREADPALACPRSVGSGSRLCKNYSASHWTQD